MVTDNKLRSLASGSQHEIKRMKENVLKLKFKILSPPITDECLEGRIFCPEICSGNILLIKEGHPKTVLHLHKAKAVVIEEAGMISHLAILCREVGIPMVQINGATKYLFCGDAVLIDFHNLTLTVLKGGRYETKTYQIHSSKQKSFT